MGYYLLIAMTVMLNVFALINTQDYNAHQRHLFELKYVAGEMAAAAAQYYDFEEYSLGNKKFLRDGGTGYPEDGLKSAHYILERQLPVRMESQPGAWVQDNVYEGSVLPIRGGYAQERVNYRIEFIDSNIPFLYEYLYEGRVLFTQVIAHPTVVVKINTGRPRYRVLDIYPDSQRISFHEWRGRE